MAQKRMFDKSIIDNDTFLELPITSQALYFHLSMRADDDGFVDNWKSISRIVGAKEDDIKILIAKSFVIPFESGIIVIKHWRINNYLQKDRKKKTRHISELQSLKEINGEYFLIEDGEISNILLLEDDEKETPEWRKKRDEAYKESSLPYSFLYKIRNAFNDCECPLCHRIMTTKGGRKYMPSIQHLIPISKGGKHELDNIAIICYSCNAGLRDKTLTNDKLNNKEVIKKWNIIQNEDGFYTRSTSANVDKYSIEENSIDNKEEICKEESNRFKKPTIEEIATYCNERNNNINPEKFYNYYESKGWMIGKNKMKNWKACVRTWEQQEKKQDTGKLPDWWDKDFKPRERTEDEERELQELIRGY